MIRKFAMATAAIALAAPAFAGGKMEPIEEPEVVEPPMQEPVAPARSWTGPYVGLNGTYIDATFTDPNDDEADASGLGVGAHLGYMYDFGGFVLGAEAEWDFYNDVEFDDPLGREIGREIDSIGRLKARAGVPIGNDLLAYGTAGIAHARVSNGDTRSDEGWLVGAGAEYMINDNFSVGGEVLYHRFDDFDDSEDLEATTVSLRGSFRF